MYQNNFRIENGKKKPRTHTRLQSEIIMTVGVVSVSDLILKRRQRVLIVLRRPYRGRGNERQIFVALFSYILARVVRSMVIAHRLGFKHYLHRYTFCNGKTTSFFMEKNVTKMFYVKKTKWKFL